MAFIDVLKYRGPEKALVWQWEPEQPSRWGVRREELRIGTQLVVNQSLVAVFVKGGQVADIFGPGTYTLSTKNLPILDRLVSLPFGKQSPFKAEVFFVNKAVVMDTKFSTPAFNMLDPNFRVPIPMQCYGSFAVRAGEARLFLTKLFGNQTVFTSEKMGEYFRGIIIECIKSEIGKVAKEQRINPMELEATVTEVSEKVQPRVAQTLERYGLHLDLFNVEGISIIDDDPRVKKIIEDYQRIYTTDLEERMRLQRRGENMDVFKVERTFDTTEAAAQNMGKSGGDGVVGTMVGLGMAQPLAAGMANMMGSALQQYPYVAQQGAPNASTPTSSNKDEILKTIRDLDALRKAGALTEEEFAEKKKDLLSKI